MEIHQSGYVGSSVVFHNGDAVPTGSMYPPVIKHSNGKAPFSIGNTSSKGSFSIAMLDYQRVCFSAPGRQLNDASFAITFCTEDARRTTGSRSDSCGASFKEEFVSAAGSFVVGPETRHPVFVCRWCGGNYMEIETYLLSGWEMPKKLFHPLMFDCVVTVPVGDD